MNTYSNIAILFIILLNLDVVGCGRCNEKIQEKGKRKKILGAEIGRRSNGRVGKENDVDAGTKKKDGGNKKTSRKKISGGWRGGPSRNGVFEVEPLKKLNGVRWKYRPGYKITTNVAVTKNAVLVGTVNGMVYAINRTKGKTLWKKRVGSEVALTIETDQNIAYLGTKKGYVYALSLESGETIWRNKIMKRVTVLLIRERLYVGGTELVSISAIDGKDVWRHEPKGKMILGIVYGDGRVLYSNWKEEHAVDADNGKYVWGHVRKQKTPSSACYNGKRFFSGWPPTFYNPKNGRRIKIRGLDFDGNYWGDWSMGSFTFPCTSKDIYGSMDINKSQSDRTDRSGYGRVSLENRKIVWMRQDLHNCSCSALARDVVYVACSYAGRKFAALRKKDGKTIWSIKMPFIWLSSPWPVDNEVFFATEYQVYALH